MVPPALSRPHSTARLAAALLLITAVSVTACTPRDTQLRRTPDEPPSAPAPAPSPPERVLAGSLHGRTGAYLIVPDAASRVVVRLARLPGLLYRISTPADSGLAPRVTGGPGRVRLGLRPTGDDGPDTVTILLNRAVRWDIRLPAGAGEQRLDLAAGQVARVDLGASGLIDISLPPPEGTVPVSLTGGVGTATITGPAPFRVTLPEGAGEITTPWRSTNGSPAGAILTAPGWPAATDRYTLHVSAGVGTLTVNPPATPKPVTPGQAMAPRRKGSD